MATKRTGSRKDVGAQASEVAAAGRSPRRKANGRNREALAVRTRQRAFEIYERRSALGVPGSDLDDWLRAEREVAGED